MKLKLKKSNIYNIYSIYLNFVRQRELMFTLSMRVLRSSWKQSSFNSGCSSVFTKGAHLPVSVSYKACDEAGGSSPRRFFTEIHSDYVFASV